MKIDTLKTDFDNVDICKEPMLWHLVFMCRYCSQDYADYKKLGHTGMADYYQGKLGAYRDMIKQYMKLKKEGRI